MTYINMTQCKSVCILRTSLQSITEWIYTYITFQRNQSTQRFRTTYLSLAQLECLEELDILGLINDSLNHTQRAEKSLSDVEETRRIYIHSTLEDNRHIDPTYKQSLQGITIEAERKAKLLGDWDAYQGQVFDEFRDRKFEDEPR